MTPLRIGVDARELLGETTGVGRYLGELLRRWTARDDADERRIVLYTPEPLDVRLAAATIEMRVLAGGGRGTWWEQTRLGAAVRRDPPDLFFAPAYTAPLGLPMPLAVTIHDVSFLAHPEWFRPRERLRRRWLTRRAAAAASVILTDSEFSRREIAGHLRAPAASVLVIPPGVTARHRADAASGQREPIVLYVGSLFNRRRLPDLIAAFARATTALPAARLVIVGDDRTWPAQDLAAIAARHGVGSRVDLLRYVDDERLAALYSRASLFAFLSEYEGFGLTPLEALAAGVPVVMLDTAVAREVCGAAATYVQRGDIDGAAEAIRIHLLDPSVASATVAHAAEVLGRYSWAAAADRTLAALERAATKPAEALP